MIMDLDHFKRFNDTYGHPVGDALLKIVSNRLKGLIRPYDVLCRYGGEEFAVILPDTSKSEAESIGERIRDSFSTCPFPILGFSESITLSMGIATYHPDELVEAWIDRADHRLYSAKYKGRNRVCSNE
jgi:diguanylate cyclase